MKIRIPLSLKAWLQAQATASRRTLTAEVIVRLQDSRVRQFAAQNTAASEAACSQAKPMD